MLVYVINGNPKTPRKTPNNMADVIPPQGKFISYTPKVALAFERKELLLVKSVAMTGEVVFYVKEKAHLAAKAAYDQLNQSNAYLAAKQALNNLIANISTAECSLTELKEHIEDLLEKKSSLADQVLAFKDEFLAEEDKNFIELIEKLKTPVEQPESSKPAVDDAGDDAKAEDKPADKKPAKKAPAKKTADKSS